MTRRLLSAYVVVISLGAGVVLVGSSESAGGLAAAPKSLIAFERMTCVDTDPGENCVMHIWAVSADRGLDRRLTQGKDPAWSPDGLKIAFVRGGQIWSMNADGSAQKRLTRSVFPESPAWSPDGRKIAYGDPRGLWVISADGRASRRLATVAWVEDLAWAPDGRVIVFSQFNSVWVVHADGSGLKRISAGCCSLLGDQPWSPDSRRIVFALDGLYVANADGSGRTRLTSHPSGDPTWSPNGLKIAFVRDSGDVGDPNTTIMVIGVQGSNRQALAPGDEPAWSPDGKRIAYSGGSSPAIHVVNTDGKRHSRVAVDGESPVWQPRS